MTSLPTLFDDGSLNRLLVVTETHDGGLRASHGRDVLEVIRALERDDALLLTRSGGRDRDR